ncbi:MAG: YdcF family protein [Propionibacteriales bacterium]|nr:YdcF family protein [Propionibacteriales bacterium]
MSIGPEIIPLVIFAVSFALEPRKFRTGLYLLGALAWLAAIVLGWTLAAATTVDDQLGGWWLLGLVVVGGLTLIGLALFMIVAGITLVRREGLRPTRLLSMALGLLVLGYLGWLAAAIVSENVAQVMWAIWVGLPLSYFGFGFTAFVIYGAAYPAWMVRFGPAADAVVVLGSGLIGGAVPPLLADRLRAGRRVYAHAVTSGRHPLLITSGGQGPDEPVAEAVAMRDFLADDGLEASSILVEDRSRNTSENLAFSAELLRARQVTGPVAVVTSDFHALRAALLMRAAGIKGYTVGARTARYFWPTAVIREYAAVLRDHFWLNAVMVALTCIPLVLTTVQAVMNRVG